MVTNPEGVKLLLLTKVAIKPRRGDIIRLSGYKLILKYPGKHI